MNQKRKTEAPQIPAFRFSGFSGEWRKTKFQEITKLSQGLQIAINKRFTKPAKNREFYITNEFLNPNSAKKYYIEKPPQNVVASPEDILMTRTGNTGKVITDVQGAFHNNFFKIKYDAKKTNKYCLFYILNTPFIQSEIITRAGTSTIPDLNHSDFYSLQFFLTADLEEQTQIGEFFQTMDRLIELQSEKVAQAERYKKAMLQKLFPQKGETIPKLRFAGFSGEWERKTLGDLINIHSGVTGDSTLSEGRFLVTRIETIAHGDVDLNKVGYINDIPQERYLLQRGDILYSNINSLSHIGKVALFDLNAKLYHGINLLRLVPKENINSFFLINYLRTEASINWAKSHANQAVSQASINQTTLAKQELCLPTYEEQTQIGNFFQILDKRIEAEAQKLDRYQTLKRAMLQRMFV